MRDGAAIADRNAPVVADRPALVRVFVDPSPGWTTRPVTARLSLREGGRVATETIEVSRTIDGASRENERASTFDIELPAGAVTPGTEWAVELLQASDCTPVAGSLGRWRFPADGSTAHLDVLSHGGAFNVVIVPVRYNGDDSGRLLDTSASQIDAYRAAMFAMFPVSTLNLTVGAVLDWHRAVLRNGSGWSDLLQGLQAHRNRENPPANTFYYGIFSPADDFRSYCSGTCITGLGSVPRVNYTYSRGAIGIGFTRTRPLSTFAHEIGRMLGRLHAPCGVSRVDGNYPYAARGSGCGATMC